MYLQLEHFRDTVSNTLNSTYEVDLPETGKLSFIYVNFNGTQTGTTPFQSAVTGKWRLVDFLDAVVVKADGVTDIFNLPGDITAYRAFLDQGITMFDKWREYSNASQVGRFCINFGAYMWDLDRFLDVSKFNNVKLQIKNSLSSTQWASANADIWLGWIRDFAGGSGNFYKAEVYRSYTTAQNGREYIEIPTGLPVRRIICQARPDRAAATGLDECSLNNLMYELKLKFKAGALVPFDGDLDELIHQNWIEQRNYPLTFGDVYHAADYAFDMGVGEIRASAGISSSRDGAVSAVIPTRLGDQSTPTQSFESYEADAQTSLITIGAGYHNCGVFSFDRMFGDIDILDPSHAGYGPVELEILTRDAASAADGTNKIVLDRLTNAAGLRR